MSPEIGVILKLCHGVPVPFRHISHPALRVVPLFDGNRVIEPFPQNAISSFRFIRRSHLKILQGANHRFTGGIEQGFFVRTVVDEKCVVHIPGAKMAAQDG